jgi:hypothetical protein
VVVSVAVGVDGRVTTTIALTLSTDAVSGRFVETEGEETSSEDAAEEPTDAVEDETTDEGGED